MREPDYTPVGRPKAHTGRPVLAIGWPLGFQALIDSGEVPKDPFEVALADRVLQLPENAYRVWLLAFGGGSRTELVAAAKADGIRDVDANVARLFRAEALVELDDDPLANTEIFEHVRLHRTGIGLGNSPERPNQFKIGLPQLGVRAVVDARVFGVWSASDGSISIADACRELAANVSNPEEPVDPEVVLGQVAVNLRVLLREGVACLDLMRDAS